MSNETIRVEDVSPSRQQFMDDVTKGLGSDPRTLPSKYFYDDRGCQLFDQICELDEYYPTRTELKIMNDHVEEMSSLIGSGCRLIEFGSGSSTKTRVLLEHMRRPVSYFPVDIACEHLRASAAGLSNQFGDVQVKPVCADFTKKFKVPNAGHYQRSVVYFPGSTIGNFAPKEAKRLLARIADCVGPGGGLLIGIDLKKDKSVLEAAYNDERGVTARFNKNILRHINRELDGDFDLDQFAHNAFYDPDQGRIEMHLVSLCDQTVHLGGESFEFTEQETICTEYSHKYDLSEFASLAERSCGWAVSKVWTDADRLFAVLLLQLPPDVDDR